MGRAGWWFIDEGPATKRLPHPHSPPRWRCRPLEIWAGTGPRVWSRTGWGDESDTALLCCTPLVRRPLRRFEGGVDEKDDGDDDAAGKMLLRLGGDEQMRPDLTPEKKRKNANSNGLAEEVDCLRPGRYEDKTGWSWQAEEKVAVDLCGISVSQWSGQAKLDVKPQKQALHY